MDNRLEILVIEKIKEKGKITFSEFMEMALFYPSLGYYQKENPFGLTGSFYTSVNASEKFGFSLANAFKYCFDKIDLALNICEMGAGSGMLANDILNYFKNNEPDLYKKINYTIIEKSSYLIQQQKDLLKEHIDKVSWTAFEDFKGFNGIFFSNELVDAFPVHRIIKTDGKIKELYVIYHDNRLQFYPDKLSDPELEDFINKVKLKLVDKQIADINLESKKWIKSLGEKIDKGIIITIDYGFTSDKLYAPFRMDGTVTCYFKHTQNNDFFDRIGYQDITAFVDFTALIEYGKDAGLNFIKLTPQSLFLVQSGILEFIKNASTDLEKSSIKSLIVPEGGFGTNFHVLLQGKNIVIPSDFIFLKSPTETYMLLAEHYERLGIESN